MALNNISMQKCSLCLQNDANKKNTHYLTDSIIRTAINYEGLNEREKGFYFNMPLNNSFVDFNFQRNTPIDKIEDAIERSLSDDEIEKAKKVPFSVDYVFCKDCENKFTQIENAFVSNILTKFRKQDLSNVEHQLISDIKLFLIFFLLQIWRTHICVNYFKLSESVAENLRKLIWQYPNVNTIDLKKYPMIINYLETLGGDVAYTSNYVGCMNTSNRYVIFMNDFFITFFDEDLSYKAYIKKYRQDTDFNNYELYINIIHNESRIQMLESIKKQKRDKVIQYCVNQINTIWGNYKNIQPSENEINKVLNILIQNNNGSPLYYSQANLDSSIESIIKSMA
ncbi:MAG: hypothetical protein MUC49_14010 [Raineya sp.]|jgi:hypothetical protein|nr:hypothetical protein [Raineya sp.]